MKARLQQRAAPAMQAKHKEQDAEPYAEKYSCATHQVTYYVKAKTKGTCPVCELGAENEYIRAQLVKLENENIMLRNQQDGMKAQIDISTAMVSAVETLDDNDKFWLKEQLYAYKLNKSVVLKVTHGKAGGKTAKRSDSKSANGFIAVTRGGEPEGHLCTSIGGLALASYYDEAATTVGASNAMQLMVKALWQFLPGARP